MTPYFMFVWTGGQQFKLSFTSEAQRERFIEAINRNAELPYPVRGQFGYELHVRPSAVDAYQVPTYEVP